MEMLHGQSLIWLIRGETALTPSRSAVRLTLVSQLLCSVAHCSVVRSLHWQPTTSSPSEELLLASASDDRSIRVLKVSV